MDDLKISHKNEKVIEDILNYLSGFYGKLSITRGDRHTYVGMDVFMPGDGSIEISMKSYLVEAIGHTDSGSITFI